MNKEQQERLDYEEKIWNDINSQDNLYNVQQEYYHFKLEVFDKLKTGHILCNCGEKAITYGLGLFMCSKCNNEMAESMLLAHSDRDSDDENMSWNYS